MRIVLVNDFYSPHMVGGAETLVKSLAQACAARGHEVAVCTARTGGAAHRDTEGSIAIYRIGDFPPFRRSAILASGTAPSLLKPQTRADFDRVVLEFAPDVVHFHNVWLLGPPLIEHAANRGYRVGLTLHDYWPFCLRRSLTRVNWEPCPGPAPLACRACKLRAAATLRSLDLLHIERDREANRQVLAACDFVTAPSRFLAQQVSRNTGTLPSVVYNGVPTEADLGAVGDRAEGGGGETAAREPYLLFAGRATREKGYEHLLRVFARPEMQDYTLLVAGEAAESRLPNVRVLGKRPVEEVRRLMLGARAVVVPSVWPENCPMVVLEALSVGTPIVGSSIGGIPELLERGVTGLLVTAGDEVALAMALRGAWHDHALRASAAQHGPQVARNRFSQAVMVDAFERLYYAA